MVPSLSPESTNAPFLNSSNTRCLAIHFHEILPHGDEIIGALESAPLDKDDLSLLRKGMDLFPFFVEVVPHKYQADDEGFLGVIPTEDLSSPYSGGKSTLEVGKGDWVIVNPKRFKQMLLEFDTKRMLTTYDSFVKYVRSNPKAPRRRDDNRHLAEQVARALADLRAAVVASSKDGNSLLFRMLPPPQ